MSSIKLFSLVNPISQLSIECMSPESSHPINISREELSSLCFFFQLISHLDFAIFFPSNLVDAVTNPNSCFSCIEVGL